MTTLSTALMTLALASWAAANPAGAPDADTLAWWSDRQGGVIGGIAGATVGLMGAVVGTLMGRGKGRILVLSLLAGMGSAGLILLPVGIAAVVMGQPYAVYYPLLLIGGMSLFFGFGGLLMARYRYSAVELQRMSAQDA